MTSNWESRQDIMENSINEPALFDLVSWEGQVKVS